MGAERSRRSRFRPCIDLHHGQVKQIVGGTLRDDGDGDLKTNFVAECVPLAPSKAGLDRSCRHPPAFYAQLYRRHDLRGGHVIKLGAGNDDAAREALQAWPGAPAWADLADLS
jgi:phosphoribosylformimino-5-aminoimidazole carboxamide ribotide isomerase